MSIALLIVVFAALFAAYAYVAKRELAKAKADADEARTELECLRRLYVELKAESDKARDVILTESAEPDHVVMAPPTLRDVNGEAHAAAWEILDKAKREAACIIESAREKAESESSKIVGSARRMASELLKKAGEQERGQNLTWQQAGPWVEKFRALEVKSEKEIARFHACEMELMAAQNQLEEARKSAAEICVLKKSLHSVADRLVKDTRASCLRDLTPNNYAATGRNITELFGFLARNNVLCDDIAIIHKELQLRFHEVARAEAAREEQRRIKTRMREEIALQRERDAELKRLAAQEKAVREALARAEAEHSGEVERLRARLGELEGAIIRAKSQAELTKAGHVYVLSNIGSFGEGVFKVGMTRRLEPLERVAELGDASVPFPFDVHMLISCEDAPALENALHRALNTKRLNKVNLRKEYFRTDIAELATIVESAHGKVEYVAEPEALQYRDSQSMTDADFAFVSGVQMQPEEDVSES